MNVKQLKAKLADAPDDQEVLIYIDGEECYGSCSSVDVNMDVKEDGPYAKGDKPDEDDPICLISGYQC